MMYLMFVGVLFMCASSFLTINHWSAGLLTAGFGFLLFLISAIWVI